MSTTTTTIIVDFRGAFPARPLATGSVPPPKVRADMDRTTVSNLWTTMTTSEPLDMPMASINTAKSRPLCRFTLPIQHSPFRKAKHPHLWGARCHWRVLLAQICLPCPVPRLHHPGLPIGRPQRFSYRPLLKRSAIHPRVQECHGWRQSL